MRQHPFRIDFVDSPPMLDTSARLLRLLSLLQERSEWTGPDLADALEVSTRTVRNDIGRLRSLGYSVQATPGVAGGYRLGPGTAIPALLFDDDEAVAVAIGLQLVAGQSVGVIEEASRRAFGKLEQVLPVPLRSRVKGDQDNSSPSLGPAVDAELLISIVLACRDSQRLRFVYREQGGGSSFHAVEPHRLVFGGGYCYVLAWDADHGDWSTFRLDRIELRKPAGPRFAPRPLPEVEVKEYVSETTD
jgi:predicted DNA-binding transcriptional regulator YafY